MIEGNISLESKEDAKFFIIGLMEQFEITKEDLEY